MSEASGHQKSFEVFVLPNPPEFVETWFRPHMLVPILVGMSHIGPRGAGMIIDFNDGSYLNAADIASGRELPPEDPQFLSTNSKGHLVLDIVQYLTGGVERQGGNCCVDLWNAGKDWLPCRVDGCRFGLRDPGSGDFIRRRWLIKASCPRFHSLFRNKVCVQLHRHLPVRTMEEGGRIDYPLNFANSVAKSFKEHLFPSRPLGLPDRAFNEVNAINENGDTAPLEDEESLEDSEGKPTEKERKEGSKATQSSSFCRAPSQQPDGSVGQGCGQGQVASDCGEPVAMSGM